ncbi:MAG: hypothetical protein K0V04_31670, partial [Deltaproteobacteria bacterium]|nr:hypothetical protein [Deltaproteobacteria bacterium]
LSVGRDRSASLSQTVVEAVRELANMQGVKKLKVKGRNDHETVDFINDLMTYTARRAEDPELRRISGEARKAAAREAYDEKKKALQPYVVSRK